jgi:tripartite-type tricarboxylate transporter receptor subunit TctC
LAVIGEARMAGLEGVQTFAEQGYKGYENVGSLAIFGPGNMPPEVIGRLNRELTRILRLPETIEFFRKINPSAVVNPSSPEELAAKLRAQHEFWGPVILRLGIRLD